MQRLRIADHKIFHAGGRDFLFLAEDNAIFELDADIRQLLTRCACQEELGRADIFAFIEGDTKSAICHSLVGCRVLINTDARKGECRSPALVPLKTLVLHLTDACNLACHYCYHSRKRGTSASQASMTLEVAKQGVDFLLEHSGPLKDVVLVFFGGEPLIRFDLISAVVPYALENAREKGKTVSFAITTNGTLLNERIIRFLYDNRMSVTISMDGSEETHDRYRRFPDGSSSYRVILPKVRELFCRTWEKPVVARVTLAQHPGNLSGMLESLLGLGFSETGFAPVTTQDGEYQLNDGAMTLLLKQFEMLAEKFLDIALKGGFLGFTNLIDLLVTLHEGEVKNYPCGAGLGLFSVAPQGRVYLCQRLTGEDRFCMGDIFGGFDQRKIEGFRSEAEISRKPICKNCWARVICAGGCYHEAWIRQGDITRPNLHYCEWIRDWTEIGLQVYGRLASEDPEYLDKLSALRGHAPMFDS